MDTRNLNARQPAVAGAPHPTPGHQPAISIRDLIKAYPERRSPWSQRRGAGRLPAVLRGVSLEVARGEIVALAGPNGAGKTTLLEILSAVLLPDSGSVAVCGDDILHEPARARDLVSYASSGAHAFYPRLTGRQNLEFFAILNGVPRDVMRRRIPEVLDLVGLEAGSDRWFQSFSDGMRQRLSLARALLKDAPVLLLDEPTRGLDPAMQQATLRLLRDTVVGALGMTVVFVTHSQAEADAIADRVAVLREGVIVPAAPFNGPVSPAAPPPPARAGAEAIG